MGREARSLIPLADLFQSEIFRDRCVYAMKDEKDRGRIDLAFKGSFRRDFGMI